MKQCSIIGCGDFVSEAYSTKLTMSRWVVLRCCRCGAYDQGNQKSCTCHNDGPIPTSYWPSLDWFAFGGVEEIVLCPQHKKEVMQEIIRQRCLDPSMNPERQNPGNVH